MSNKVLVALCSAAFLTLGPTISAQNAPKPDNTTVNKGDREPGAVTADQSKNNKADVKLAADIRKAIRNDKSLSTYAHNVKVIAQNGQVTLKGPVRTEDEKQAVLSEAKAAASGASVSDEMTVAPSTQSK